MTNIRRRRSARLRLSRTLCLSCATWLYAATAIDQAGTSLTPPSDNSSRKPTNLIPSASRSSNAIPSPRLTLDDPSFFAPSDTSSYESAPTTDAPSARHTGLIPSAPISPEPQTNTLDSITSLASFIPIPINGTITVPQTNASSTIPPTGTTSTSEGLHPIPPPPTSTGDPNGHNEIPAPNFSNTDPCHGCSPAIEITATGWESMPTFQVPPAQEQATKANSLQPLPVITITAGPSTVEVKPAPSGGDFVIGDSTVKPGQTATFENTPIVVRTSNRRTEVIIGGTQTVPLNPPFQPPVATIPIGSSHIIVKPAPSGANFIIGTLTVSAGHTATISGTPIAVQTAGPLTQIIISGAKTIPLPANPLTTPFPIVLPSGETLTPILVSNSDPNAQLRGYILRSSTLLPGGPALTISGTTYSLLPSSTALLVNGALTMLTQSYGEVLATVSAAPVSGMVGVTAVMTVPRSTGTGWGGAGGIAVSTVGKHSGGSSLNGLGAAVTLALLLGVGLLAVWL